MVLIEPNTEQGKTEDKVVHKETISVTAEQPVEQPPQQSSEFIQTLKEGFKRFLTKIKEQGFSITTFGMPTQKRAAHYVQKCWAHMAKNEVRRAKKNYDELVKVYETMPDGQPKVQTYQEVYEIYTRLAEVKD